MHLMSSASYLFSFSEWCWWIKFYYLYLSLVIKLWFNNLNQPCVAAIQYFGHDSFHKCLQTALKELFYVWKVSLYFMWTTVTPADRFIFFKFKFQNSVVYDDSYRWLPRVRGGGAGGGGGGGAADYAFNVIGQDFLGGATR